MGRAATPQEVHEAIFGAGVDFVWWRQFVPLWGWEHEQDDEVPDGWTYEVTSVHPEIDNEDRFVRRIGTYDIRTAARKIADDPEYRASLRDECRNLLRDAESLDLDAPDADVVLQVAMYGEVIFG